MPKAISKCKIACLDMNLQKTRMQMGIQILVTDPKELEKIREEELNITRNRIKMLLDAGRSFVFVWAFYDDHLYSFRFGCCDRPGANVILTTKGIDDMTLKYFVEAGAIAARRIPKDDIRRIAKATGAQVLMSFSDMDGNETVEPSMLGDAEEVSALSASAMTGVAILSISCPLLSRGSGCRLQRRGWRMTTFL